MNVLDTFFKVTGYRLDTYISDVEEFLSSGFGQIVSYYKGDSFIDKGVFSELNRLISESHKIEEIVLQNSSSLSETTLFWDLQDLLTGYSHKLWTILNLGKWMRSSYLFGYEGQSKVSKILKQNQTLENLSVELGSSSPNKDWVDLAISNQIFESDYDKSGGNSLEISKKKNIEYNIATTVDNMIGKNILGKDLAVKVQFIDDDYEALSVEDTFEQSSNICLRAVKGSVPEYPFLGVSKNFVGANLATFRSGSLVREVIGNFKTDDSFKTVELVESGNVGEFSFYDFKITSKLGQEININL